MAEQSNMLWFSETALKSAFPGSEDAKLTLANGSALNFVPGPGFGPLKSLSLFNALTLPIKHPSTAALISDLNEFNFKEPQMSDEIAVNREKSTLETRNHDAKVANAMDTIAKAINDVFEDVHWADANQNELGSVLDVNAELRSENAALRSRLAVHQNRNLELEARVANQRATIENFQRQLNTSDGAHQLTAEAAHLGAKAAESAESSLKAQLERALHTQKILERDLEEYQQAYADLKASVFSDDDQLPGRLLAFGHGDYLAYPAKVCASDDDTAPKWGLIIDPNTPFDRDTLDQLIDKNLVLTDGDVAITFEKPSDVTRLIDTLTGIVWRMYVDSFESASKTE